MALRVLVTGGSGFIGSHVLDVLVARGHAPVNFDRVESPHHEGEAIDTVLGDATDANALAAAMDGCEAVIHLAAMADVNDVQKDPEGAEVANARATLAVLEAARRAGVQRVVYGSTIWVYSDVPETEVCEQTRLEPPAHLYTATKLAGELYCRSYAELYGLEYTVLRFGIPYGPRARDATVLAAFTRKALGGEPLTVAGSGDQTRRFVYVEDLADGVVRAAEEPAAANRIYNLTGSETTTILEIAEAVRDLVGDAEIVHTPARAGDFGGKEVSSERALAELGWAPVTPFREGARRYVEWRLERERAPVPALVAASNGHAAVAESAKRGRRPLRGLATAWLTIPRRVRPVVSGALISAVFFWSFASDDGLAVFAWAFPSAKPVNAVETSAPEVGLIVDAPPAQAAEVAQALASTGAGATIALTAPAPKATVDAVHAAGSDVMPRLKPGGPVRWIGTRGQLRKTARGLGIHGHFYYAAPGHGFTLAQEMLGSTTDATPITGSVKLKAGGLLGKLDRGDLVEISLDGSGDWRPWVSAVAAQLRARGLRATPATGLVRTKPDEH
ncbi:MAG TPA: NAD-dependent epimerase/dehydratase family protein [Thermoleophilaceae bacterium]